MDPDFNAYKLDWVRLQNAAANVYLNSRRPNGAIIHGGTTLFIVGPTAPAPDKSHRHQQPAEGEGNPIAKDIGGPQWACRLHS